MESLDDGEKAALALAASLAADLVLMDDRDGVRIARNKGVRVIGTLRVLQLDARSGLLDLGDASNALSGRISAIGRRSWMNCSIKTSTGEGRF
jgi:predicted nucleic acid-binding protein